MYFSKISVFFESFPYCPMTQTVEFMSSNVAAYDQLYIELGLQYTCRVFKLDLPQNKHLLGHQKCTYKSKNRNLYIHEMRNFDLWPLDFVENNIPVLYSLSPEWWQNFTWNSIILFRNIFFSKHQNKVILAISILISRTWVVLKTSVA
jgi:hypothetical protein